METKKEYKPRENKKIINWDSIKTSLPVGGDCTVVAWLDNQFCIDTWDNFFNEFKEKDINLIQRLRVFNANGELHVWRSNGLIKGALRIDDDTLDYEEVKQLLWGTIAEEKDGKLTLTEERGTEITIPKPKDYKNSTNTRFFIKTRNYIDYTAAGHATYADCRFVEIIMENKEKTK